MHTSQLHRMPRKKAVLKAMLVLATAVPTEAPPSGPSVPGEGRALGSELGLVGPSVRCAGCARVGSRVARWRARGRRFVGVCAACSVRGAERPRDAEWGCSVARGGAEWGCSVAKGVAAWPEWCGCRAGRASRGDHGGEEDRGIGIGIGLGLGAARAKASLGLGLGLVLRVRADLRWRPWRRGGSSRRGCRCRRRSTT